MKGNINGHRGSWMRGLLDRVGRWMRDSTLDIEVERKETIWKKLTKSEMTDRTQQWRENEMDERTHQWTKREMNERMRVKN